ncbi:uncharacterized protein LOC112568213 isoform X1 [Pomacea canaliculata]|uniref:uncharacterized protein LOC112568213 isoform X1 n=1 Tax=Pomacea canaliculata TaxID=400727 RepID=UPI000D73EE80|nr:uncharacterized protein LOC112568213 isoform X1 [Pomacea canaliculata]
MVKFYIYVMLFVSLWKSAASSKSCVKIEVVEDFAKDGIVVVEQNDNVSLTFDVNIDACQNNTQKLALSSREGELPVAVCKIIFTNGTCHQHMAGQPCSCVNSTKHRVHFHQSITGVDYKIYDWTAASNTSVRENLMELIFVIRTHATGNNCSQIFNESQMENEDKGDCYRHVVIAVTSSVFVVVTLAVVAVPLGFLLRRKWREREARTSEKVIHPSEVIYASKPSLFK